MKRYLFVFVLLLILTASFAEIIIDEDFSGTFPPTGWNAYGMNPGNWSQSTTSNAGGTSPELCFNWSPSFTGEAIYASGPVNTVGATSLDLIYSHFLNDFSGSGYTIGIKTSSDGVTWNTAYEVAPTGDIGPVVENLTITTSDVGSESFQLGFFFNGYSFDLDYWYIDDVLLEGTLITYDNDLAGLSVNGDTVVNAGNTENYEIAVKNVGYNSQDSYTVKLFKNNNTELSSIDIIQTIAPDEIVIHSLVWNVPADEPAGSVMLHGQVILAGDENTLNDETGTLEVTVFPQGVLEITIGEGIENNTRTPLSFEHKNSLTEILYFADELAGAEGMITAITYYTNFTDDLMNKPTALWIGETTQTNLTDGWIPSTSLTEVFNSTVSYFSASSSVQIQLTTPYYYNGGNLVVMAHRPMDTQNYGTTNYFLHDTTLEHMDRTRYERDDTLVFDPANPPEVSYSGEFFANTTFTFYLGAMGEVEGYVYDDANNPLAEAQITIEETQTVTNTDNLGYYHFGNILEGEYDFTAELMGYSPQTITGQVIEDEVTQLDFNLIPLGLVAVSGHVVGSDLPAIGLENAIVEITGFENYEATTDENGDFVINDVYTNITYNIQISLDGYDNYAEEIIVGSTALDLGTITLNEIALPPGNVQAVQDPFGIEVALSWSSPGQGGGEFRYDDGEQDFLFGLNSTPPNAVFGAVHPNISIVEEIQWYLCSDYAAHNQVKLYLFGLDENGEPNTDVVLYESGFINNIDDEWNIHLLEEPIEAFEGFFMGVSTPNLYTAIGLDDGDGEPWEYQSGTQYLIEDWTTGGMWTVLDSYGPNYERNFMIRAYGINMGNTLPNDQVTKQKPDSAIMGSREFESFNVYRFYESQHNNPEDWELIAQEIGDTIYVDQSWVLLQNATYQFAIRSVYTNGVESISAFSQLITKTSATAGDLPQLETKLYTNFPNPFNPSTTITFSIANKNFRNVELNIYNLKGQRVKKINAGMLTSGQHSFVWNGTDDNDKAVSSGVYFYRLVIDRNIIDTKRMLLLK